MEKITVIGAGAWGTSLANLLSHKGYDVMIWCYEEELPAHINEEHVNTIFLPDIELSPTLRATNSFDEAFENNPSVIVNAVPSHGIRGVFKEIKSFINNDTIIVSVSKGLEEGSMKRPSEILKEVLGKIDDNLVVFSGPTFAKEVSLGLPSAVTASSVNRDAAEKAQKLFSNEALRVYTNKDPLGVELGGVLKNVMAIAAGVSEGLGLGNNARAALITRGLHEMTSLGVKMGAMHDTFSGLSGMGDLILTCTGALSRNRTVGERIGKGEKLDDIIKSMKMVAEGVKTSKSVIKLAKEYNIEMPIAECVYKVLHEGLDPHKAVTNLMTRKLIEE